MSTSDVYEGRESRVASVIAGEPGGVRALSYWRARRFRLPRSGKARAIADVTRADQEGIHCETSVNGLEFTFWRSARCRQRKCKKTNGVEQIFQNIS